jgi:hypothetical protein
MTRTAGWGRTMSCGDPTSGGQALRGAEGRAATARMGAVRRARIVVGLAVTRMFRHPSGLGACRMAILPERSALSGRNAHLFTSSQALREAQVHNGMGSRTLQRCDVAGDCSGGVRGPDDRHPPVVLRLTGRMAAEQARGLLPRVELPAAADEARDHGFFDGHGTSRFAALQHEIGG